MQTEDLRIYLDLEYIYPGMNAGSGRPTQKDLRQIVQIGAILFDNDQGKELSVLNILTIPAYNKELPPFFVELTGIDKKQLEEEGISFERGFKELVSFCGDHPVWTFDKDQEVLEQNCSYFNIEFPWQKFERVKPKLIQWGIAPNDYSSGTLYQAVGLEMSGQVHNALHDVRSMAGAVHVLEKN